MPASTHEAGLGSRAAVISIAVAILFLGLIGLLAVPAHASDDSNAGQLTPTPTVNPQELNSALSSLAQGANDTAVQQLIAQFQSQMNGGDFSGAASTLVQLKGLSSGDQSGVPQSLNALLQSLAVGSNGASVNATTLASLLNSSPGAYSGTQQKLSVDMQTLANLMRYANSTLASQLLQSSGLLSQNAFAGNGGGTGSGSHFAIPGVSSLPGLSIPPLSAPSLSVGGPSGGLPSISPTGFAVPLIAAAVVAAFFLYRGRIVGLIGAQSLPGIARFRGGLDHGVDDSAAVPSDARKRIEYYFGRAVRLMAKRGVPKLSSDTHREFASNCERTPERPQVGTISSLYEKAKFSGQGVGAPDADAAAAALLAMGKEEP